MAVEQKQGKSPLDLDRARLDAGLRILRRGLATFLETEFRSKYREQALQKAKSFLSPDGQETRRDPGPIAKWDVADLLKLLFNAWIALFGDTFEKSDRSLVAELQGVRNRWAHQQEMSPEWVDRALQSAQFLLELYGLPDAEDLASLRRCRFTIQVDPGAGPALDVVTIEASRASFEPRFVRECRWNLWREVIQDYRGKPHGHVWALALTAPKPIPDQVNGPDPAEEILCEISRRPAYSQRPRVMAWIKLLGVCVFLYFGVLKNDTIIHGPHPFYLAAMLVALSIAIVVDVVQGSERQMVPPRRASQWNVDDWRTVKAQVRELLTAAQASESACPSLLLRRAALAAPKVFLDREAEILGIRDDANNPLRSEARRGILVDFVLEVMPGELDIAGTTNEEDSVEQIRARLFELFRIYWDKDFEALQLAHRLTMLESTGGDPNAVTPEMLEPAESSQDGDEHGGTGSSKALKPMLVADLRAAESEWRAAGVPESEIQRRKVLGVMDAAARSRDLEASAERLSTARRLKKEGGP